MTDTTIPPLTGADVKALGFTPFGYERDDRMGGVLAHKDGEAFYMQRAAAFWSIDPEYGNMRNVLCEAPPNWRDWRTGCNPRLIVDTDVLLWRVSELPTGAVERLFGHDQITPVLAGLKAQAEVEPPIGNEVEHEPVPEPAYRNPLKVGDRVCYIVPGANEVLDGVVEETRGVLSWREQSRQCRVGGEWHWEMALFLILPREGE